MNQRQYALFGTPQLLQTGYIYAGPILRQKLLKCLDVVCDGGLHRGVTRSVDAFGKSYTTRNAGATVPGGFPILADGFVDCVSLRIRISVVRF